MKSYVNDFLSITTDQKVESLCNEIAFTNSGTQNILVNGRTIVPGETISISGNGDEKDVTDYNVSFSSSDTAPKCDVIRKRYV